MKVLFINLVYGTGSTGKIIADIMDMLKSMAMMQRLYTARERVPTMRTRCGCRGSSGITFTTRYRD